MAQLTDTADTPPLWSELIRSDVALVGELRDRLQQACARAVAAEARVKDLEARLRALQPPPMIKEFPANALRFSAMRRPGHAH